MGPSVVRRCWFLRLRYCSKYIRKGAKYIPTLGLLGGPGLSSQNFSASAVEDVCVGPGEVLCAWHGAQVRCMGSSLHLPLEIAGLFLGCSQNKSPTKIRGLRWGPSFMETPIHRLQSSRKYCEIHHTGMTPDGNSFEMSPGGLQAQMPAARAHLHHKNLRILQTMISGIPVLLALGARM